MYVASQRLEQLLELLSNDGDTRPLVVTSRDRLDIVLGLLASQVGLGLCEKGGATHWFSVLCGALWCVLVFTQSEVCVVFSAAQVSVAGPNVAGILLTHAGPRVLGSKDNGGPSE